MVYDEKGRIIQATKSELSRVWLGLDLYELYSFDDYLRRMKSIGVTILEEEESNASAGNYERSES